MSYSVQNAITAFPFLFLTTFAIILHIVKGIKYISNDKEIKETSSMRLYGEPQEEISGFYIEMG